MGWGVEGGTNPPLPKLEARAEEVFDPDSRFITRSILPFPRACGCMAAAERMVAESITNNIILIEMPRPPAN